MENKHDKFAEALRNLGGKRAETCKAEAEVQAKAAMASFQREHPEAAQVVNTWANPAAAVAASSATLEATDPQTAMRDDKAKMADAWERLREQLAAVPAYIDRSGTVCPLVGGKDAAQKLLGKASAAGDVEGMQRAVAAAAT